MSEDNFKQLMYMSKDNMLMEWLQGATIESLENKYSIKKNTIYEKLKAKRNLLIKSLIDTYHNENHKYSQAFSYIFNENKKKVEYNKIESEKRVINFQSEINEELSKNFKDLCLSDIDREELDELLNFYDNDKKHYNFILTYISSLVNLSIQCIDNNIMLPNNDFKPEFTKKDLKKEYKKVRSLGK